MIDGSKKTAIVSWLMNFRIRMFVKSAVNYSQTPLNTDTSL